MKHFTLTRGFMSDKVTLGMLKADGENHEPIYTLELPWHQNKRRQSCIPTGVYRCLQYGSARFVDVYQVQEVPNRDAILIHTGNTVDDIEGCILIGLSTGRIQDKPAVLESRKALELLHKLTKKTGFMLAITQG